MRADIRTELQGHLLAGRYRLDRLIAAGGMADVWQATDTVLARRVAVKVLLPQLAADPDFVRRFRREALSAARLNHPSIVAIYDSCSEGELEAIVMELVDGETLRQRLDRGPLDAHAAIGIAAQAAAALDAAHGAGIIHRDIKPANLLLCRTEHTAEGLRGVPRVMVTDFGIAKAITEAGGDGGADLTSLTKPGSIVGTAKYLAPEQVQGHPVDRRTDIYALGVVLYECVCGRPPFAGESELAVAIARLQSDPLLPRQVRPDVRRDLEAVILRAMAREPDRRYATAADLRAALLAVDPGPPAVPPALADPTSPAVDELPSFVQSERSWILPAGLVALVAAALIAAGIVLGRTATGRDLVDRALVAVGARSESPPTTALPAPHLLGPLEATIFDPQGDKTENDALAHFAVDGDPATIWRTECYANVFAKAGVGIIVRVGSAATLDHLEVEAQANGWSASVYVGDGSATTLEQWGAPVDTQSGTTATTFNLHHSNGTAVLLWVTDLSGVPPDNCFGVRPNSRRLEVREMRLFGA